MCLKSPRERVEIVDRRFLVLVHSCTGCAIDSCSFSRGVFCIFICRLSSFLHQVREVRRLGMYGLTTGELNRFSSALLTDARQLAAQGNRISNGEFRYCLVSAFLPSPRLFEHLHVVHPFLD